MNYILNEEVLEMEKEIKVYDPFTGLFLFSVPIVEYEIKENSIQFKPKNYKEVKNYFPKKDKNINL